MKVPDLKGADPKKIPELVKKFLEQQKSEKDNQVIQCESCRAFKKNGKIIDTVKWVLILKYKRSPHWTISLMKTKNFLIFIFLFPYFFSCRESNTQLKKPFFNLEKKYIGDSLFVNELIKKIIFVDSSFEIDSIVFNRYYNSRSSLKSINTFKAGKNIFENIDYFENGNIKKYSFIDEDSDKYIYERFYSENGTVKSISGNIFFQGYVTNINTENLEVKKGTSIAYKIYYPSPPDCKVNLYIKYDNGTEYDVFQKSTFLNFLQTVSNANTDLGTYKVNILLKLRDSLLGSVSTYNHELFYKVVP